MLEVRTPLLIQVSYEDRSFAFYDKEEDSYFGGETADAEIESTPVIRVFAKLLRNPARVAGLQIITGEVHVGDEADTFK